MKKHLLLSFAIAFIANIAVSQTWVDKMKDPSVNFYDVQKTFNSKYHKKEKEMQRERYEKNIKQRTKNSVNEPIAEENEGELPGWELYKRWENYMKPRVYPTGDRTVMLKAMQEYYDTYYPGGLKKQLKGVTSTQAANWTFVGASVIPSGGGGAGRINFVRFDPTTTSTMYAGSPAGGFWKSTTSGTSWTTTTDQLPNIGCTDLAINPNNGQEMYLAMGDGEAQDTYSIGIYKSMDGGATWNSTTLNWSLTNYRSISRLLINPQNPSVVYAATSIGIFRTRNAGATWAIVSGTSGFNVRDIEYRPSDTTTIYATTNTKFYKSTNGGVSFTNITTGLPSSSVVGRLAVAVTPADANYVYILAADTGDGYYGIYQSTDSGTNFSVKSTSPNLLGYSSTGSDTGGQGWYDLSLAVSNTNKLEVIVGGVNIWRSTNGGGSFTFSADWTGNNAAYVHADIHALEYLPGSGTTFFVGCDGGVFKTTNSGTAYSDLSAGLQIAQIYRFGLSATNQNLLVSGWQDNGTNKWSGGSTWSNPLGGDGMESIVDWSNANVQYGELYYGDINRTTTGGNMNTNIVSSGGSGVDADGDWVTPYIMNPLKASTLLVGKGQVYKSVNRGGAWSQIGTVSLSGSNLIAMAYAPSDTNYIYVATDTRLFVSTNGTSFTNRTTGLPVSSEAITYIAVSKTNPQHVWVTFSGYTSTFKVYYSADAGVTWTNYTNTGLPNLPVNCIVYQNNSTNDALYIGTDVGVYYRDNTMSSWANYSTGLPNVIVKELEIQYAGLKLRAATFGRGVWESDLYAPVASVSVVTSTGSSSVCVGTSVTFTATPTNGGTAPTYQWQVNGSNVGTTDTYTTSSLTNGQIVTCIMTSNLSGVTGSPATSNSITMTVGSTIPTITVNSPTVCSGKVGVITASGGTTYSWSTGATTTTLSVTPAVTTTYTVTGTSSGCSNSTTAFITVNQNPTVTVNSPTICSGQTTTLTASGGNTYVWTGGSTANSLSVTPTITTTYTVTGTNSVGCTNTTKTTVVVNTTATPTISQSGLVLTSSATTGNQWYFNGSIISGATSQTYTVTQNGDYTVISTVSGCSSATSSTTTIINVGIVEVTADYYFSVYPNPSDGNFVVTFNTAKRATYKLELVNALGQSIYKETLTDFSGSYSKSLDVTAYGKGIYLISITNPKNETVKKIVVY